MISVQEAKDLIRTNVKALQPEVRNLLEATGHVLASDIFADRDFPSFEQAAMDGYAFCFDDLKTSSRLKISGESAAGNPEKQIAGREQAVRIFTGAPLPQRTDTVVMQEKTMVLGNDLIIKDDQLQKSGNVRPTGSEISKGSLAISAGTFLTPAAVGFLASLGKTEVPVIPKPRISLIITGNELVSPGEDLPYGKVYESNSFALRAALQQMHLSLSSVCHVEDKLPELEQALKKALNGSDLILLTGGISAGDYDYVARATVSCGVEQVFHKIRQKPGKPLYFGRKGSTLVFGLPGNPSSVLTCFYEYVVPSILYLMGSRKTLPEILEMPLSCSFRKKPGLTQFLKGQRQEGRVTPLDAQESYRMRSFAVADCLIVLPEEKTEFEKDEFVEVHFLP